MGISMVLWVAIDVFAAGLLRESPIPQVVWLRYLFHIGLMIAVLGPTAGLSFVRDPMGTPQIPNWSRVTSALPDLLVELRAAIEADRRGRTLAVVAGGAS